MSAHYYFFVLGGEAFFWVHISAGGRSIDRSGVDGRSIDASVRTLFLRPETERPRVCARGVDGGMMQLHPGTRTPEPSLHAIIFAPKIRFLDL